jgi:hypothetical protein
VLQFLDIATVSLVCKYWHDICHCEYVEGREAPNSDYLPVPMLSVLPALPAHPQLAYDPSSTHHAMPAEIVVPVPGPSTGLSSGKGEMQSPLSPLAQQGAVVTHLKEEVLSSLSDDNHIGRSCTVLKRQGEIERYLEAIEQRVPSQSQSPNGGESEVKQTDAMAAGAEREEMKRRLLSVQQMESEKSEVKEKIFQWKRHFEKKYRRAPSDEEKVRNIPGLFQRYSIVSASLPRPPFPSLTRLSSVS